MLATNRIALALLLSAATAAASFAGTSARQLYEQAAGRERAVRTVLARGQADRGLLTKARPVVVSYERLVRRYPRSGYCDNALWQGAELSAELWARFGQAPDRATAIRLYKWLAREYPRSPYASRARTASRRVEASAHARAAAPPPERTRPLPAAPAPPVASSATPASTANPGVQTTPTNGISAGTGAVLPTLREIRHTVLPDAVRVIVELDEEVPFREERIANPDRVFIDLQGVRAAPELRMPQDVADGLVKQIRLGQHPDDTLRIVLDIDGAARHTVFPLYSPYRLVIDMEAPATAVRTSANAAGHESADPVAAVLEPPPDARPGVAPANLASPAAPPSAPVEKATTLPSREPPVAVPAGPPAANLRGRFSLSRQLGLGVSRIVIDPGHGGKDPGARSKSLTEADIVLDVALRLEQLLLKEEGFEVVVTRRSDVYIPLEERTAIANREDADLFLSIHANASRNKQAHGVETYFLNFATTPDAEAVAARENAASDQTMHRLPDIVKAITLNNKLAESRDFATFVQRSMIERLRASNKHVRDLGVKQAPFVVLIGAGMPSILAEISFLTHAQEGRLLAAPTYRQKIAEALLAGVLRYQRSLKSVQVAQSD